mgnify:CR=1 FL=1
MLTLVFAFNTQAEVSDPHSFANFNDVVVKHIDLDLNVDFKQSILKGSATLSYQNLKQVDQLILDTRDLTIHQITSAGKPVEYQLAAADKNLGRALTIDISKANGSITVEYQTSPDASGLQWLTPEQTAGKKQPFLFSQAQAIHARSFIPLQDTPSARVTYKANIKTPKNLLAVMSASNDPDTQRDGDYYFDMPQAIPSYLIAIAVGDLTFEAIGDRTGVYSEPSMLAASVKEFEDTQAMLEVTEKMYGKYRWDRYDLLILPPSFPFGGMENPRLSFITPTVIAGDKSLVSLIAHELAHSWSGNTVTNASWRDLWLNEGFTTYLTYRIMEVIYGSERFDMEALLGYQSLQHDLSVLGEPDQRLTIDLTGRDPDDVFSDIPYEKGALFVRELEHLVGRKNFDQFLMNYFEDFAFESIDTETFLAYIDKKLIKPYKLDNKRIEQWIYQPGLPVDHAIPKSNAFTLVDNGRANWLSGNVVAKELVTSNWTVHQWLHFLNNMPETMNKSQLDDLDAAFNLTSSSNNEIAHSWLMIAVRNNYQAAWPRLEQYLLSIGRNKLVKPLYQSLSKTKAGKAFGKRVFNQAKSGYHPLTVKANERFFK